MKNITKEELKAILTSHQLWIDSKEQQGTRANLDLTNLEGMDFAYANLQNAFLENANLQNANLQNANLTSAHLERANLYGANLQNANLAAAHLYGTSLERANLQNANLQNVDLEGTYLRDAILPEKQLNAGKLYDVKHNYIHNKKKTLVCLIRIKQDKSLDFIEAVSGKIHRNQPSWFRYAFNEAKE